MAEIRVKRIEQGQAKIRNVPIAVTPEGFWCCPSPVAFQKTLKSQSPLNPKPKTPKRNPQPVTKPPSVASNEQHDVEPISTAVVVDRTPKPKIEGLPRKVTIEFGEPGTSDIKVVLTGKPGFCVKLSVHRNVLVEHSSFFANKLSQEASSLEIDDCEDVEIYVETVGLMYCKEMKQRLIKQSVARVLRVLKVGEFLGFNKCIQTCLEYLEAVPWIGEEEEENVVSSVLRLQKEGIKVAPILKRVSSSVTTNAPKDTLSQIIELVLESNEEKGRREMKSVVLKLLKEKSNNNNNNNNICYATIYSCCQSCLSSLLSVFRQAIDTENNLAKKIALEADNISWLFEILAARQAADEFAELWSGQQELANLHPKVPIMSRHHVSCITAKLFVGIGRGELLPSKDTRQLLLQTWLEPLYNDYNWLKHGCRSRSFDMNVVEEGIGRTILTLPLEDQQSILLGWLGRFLKGGENCPNLQRAFEVWWRRTFARPYSGSQSQGDLLESDVVTSLNN